LRSGARLERVLLAEGLGRAPVIDEIRDLAAEAGIPVECVKRDELDRLSARGAHQGVIAAAAPFEYAELTDVLSAIATQPRALVVVLDHITDRETSVPSSVRWRSPVETPWSYRATARRR